MLMNKKILMIIASNNFRDEEYNEPRSILEKNNAKITVASTTLNEAKGMLGLKVKPDILLDNVNVDDYDAIVFVGGSGATEYWENNKAHEIAKDAYNKKKVLAAICIAPITLAKAGLLKGKNATVYSSEVENIKNLGANYTGKYTGKPVEADDLIITANGPASAKEFGEKIVELLNN
jgi:protease I